MTTTTGTCTGRVAAGDWPAIAAERTSTAAPCCCRSRGTAAGYRPCAVCLPAAYRTWKAGGASTRASQGACASG